MAWSNTKSVPPASGAGRRVVVIGAGAVGVCCANYLVRAGFDVTVIDTVEPGSSGQCSYGNAGGLSPGSCIPNAMPGIIKEVPGMLLDPEGPISLRLMDVPHALPWLMRFLWSSRRRRVEEVADAMIALNRHTFESYDPLVREAQCADLISHRGQLIVYEDLEGPAKSALSVGMRRARGVKVEILNASQIRELEPAISSDYKAAVYLPEQGQCANPGRMVASLWRLAVAKGVRLHRAKAKGFVLGGSGVRAVATDNGSIEADHFVVAAGAFSGPFAQQLGVRVPLICERGYHVVIEGDGTGLRVQTNSASRKFVAAPMEDGLRLSGTVEFARPGTGPRWERAAILVRQGQHMFPGIDTSRVRRWMGNRPGTPDSIPVIERTARHPNVILAFGHGHQGLIGASTTGRLVTELAEGRPTMIDLTPYQSSRF
ncbi:D-amino-acid dehydrogenase [Arboricoccus pini]|uniref:D-amino-acid dehydrogenase n=1 Tax=Arboricoccus pini TaxID=1963835 RepID=A0A212RWU5_9PROT|nr:FAD-dependent oxidoreductase [Arboricoccus pini]SNB77123.1 D-amino-acid dehydrogenase [Arboricoccus pini]